MSTDPPPFERHHRTAQALVSAFQEALEPQFTAKGALSREDFTRPVWPMMAHWPSVLPLFATICQSCTASACSGCGPADAAADAGATQHAGRHPGSEAALSGTPRRKSPGLS